MLSAAAAILSAAAAKAARAAVAMWSAAAATLGRIPARLRVSPMAAAKFISLSLCLINALSHHPPKASRSMVRLAAIDADKEGAVADLQIGILVGTEHRA